MLNTALISAKKRLEEAKREVEMIEREVDEKKNVEMNQILKENEEYKKGRILFRP